MRLFSKIALITGITLILVHQFGIYYFKSTMKEVTTGSMIDVEKSPNAALLVIDIQNGYLSPYPDDTTKAFIDNTNKAIDCYRSEKQSVIFITMTREGHSLRSILTPDIPDKGTEAARITAQIHIGSHPIIFNKLRQDAFSNPALENYLHDKKIGRLYIAGMLAEYCVNATIHGALNRGYQVNVLPEAILAEGGERSMQKVLRQYARIGVQTATLNPLNLINE